MPSDLEFTGERFVPGVAGEIAHEHWHRYAFARRFAAGRRVLDVSCGEGYGSALLADVAAHVTGVDIAAEAVAHACATYGRRANVRFVRASAAALPLADASVDVAVSFETIEHLPRALQPRMLAELARVLTPSGVLVLSAPDPAEYSDKRGYRNPHHLHEPPRDELDALLAVHFAARRWYRQRRWFGSALWREERGDATFEAWTGDGARIEPAAPPPAMYVVAVAARDAAALPPPGPALTLFTDRDEGELGRLDARAVEVLRLDALLAERDAALDRQAAHVRHLEEIAAYRERIVVERDAQLAATNAAREEATAARDALARERDAIAAERDTVAKLRQAALAERDAALASAQQAHAALTAEIERLERALAAQERIIAYRQSARWWLALPWLRAGLALRRLFRS
ncbi:MAG: methyltransferase domain-containing protein [Burkholderiales bacterium]